MAEIEKNPLDARAPRPAPRLSLIVATVGRRDALRDLLVSLVAQSFGDFEVILVDQNPSDLLGPILARFAGLLALQRLRVPACNLSHARNIGMPVASGEIIGFPDDDCQYPPGLLARVAARFASDPELQFLSGPAISATGGFSSGRWRRQSGPISEGNVWTSVIAFNMFVRGPALHAAGGFDEELGVGARFGSAEETDLAIRLIRRGRGAYDFELRAIHPDKGGQTARAFAYGAGLGRVMRRQRAALPIVATFLGRPLGGVVISLLRGRMDTAIYYWRTWRGRCAGYLHKL